MNIFGNIIRLRFGEFYRMALVFKRIKGDSQTKVKQVYLLDYFKTLKDGERDEFLRILTFIKDKPKINISETKLEKYFQALEQQRQKEIRAIYAEHKMSKKRMLIEDMAKIISLQNQESPFSLTEISRFLHYFEVTTGKGSIDSKLQYLKEILSKFSALEAEYFLRIIANNLGIGLNKRSINRLFFTNQPHNSGVREAQDAESVNSKNQSQNQRSNTRPSFTHNVITNTFQPMLCRSLNKFQDLSNFLLSKKNPFFADVKYDGERTIITYERGREFGMMSRNKKNQIPFYEELSKRIWEELESRVQIERVIMDGEIVCVDEEEKPLPMQMLRTKRRMANSKVKRSGKSDGSKVLVYGFDVLELNGRSKMEASCAERRRLLPRTAHLRVAEHCVFGWPEEEGKLLGYFEEKVAQGYEGLVLKSQHDPYNCAGLRGDWAKMKRGLRAFAPPGTSNLDLDLVVMAGYFGKHHKRTVCSFLLGIPAPHHHQPINIKPIDIKPTDIKPTDIKPTDIKPIDIKPTDIQHRIQHPHLPIDIQHPNIQHRIQPTEIKHHFYPISKVGSGFTLHEAAEIRSLLEPYRQSEPPPNYIIPHLVSPDVWYQPKIVLEVACQEFTRSPLYQFAYQQKIGGVSLRFPIFKAIRHDKNADQATSADQILQILNSL